MTDPDDMLFDVTVYLDGLDTLDLDNAGPQPWDMARILAQVQKPRIKIELNENGGKTQARIWIDLNTGRQPVAKDRARRRQRARPPPPARPQPPQPQPPTSNAGHGRVHKATATAAASAPSRRAVVLEKHIQRRRARRTAVPDKLRRTAAAYMLKQPAVSVVHAALRYLD